MDVVDFGKIEERQVPVLSQSFLLVATGEFLCQAKAAIKERMVAKSKGAVWKPVPKRGDVSVIITFLNLKTFHQIGEFVYISPALICL